MRSSRRRVTIGSRHAAPSTTVKTTSQPYQVLPHDSPVCAVGTVVAALDVAGAVVVGADVGVETGDDEENGADEEAKAAAANGRRECDEADNSATANSAATAAMKAARSNCRVIRIAVEDSYVIPTPRCRARGRFRLSAR